jgi:hypothetical protein
LAAPPLLSYSADDNTLQQ